MNETNKPALLLPAMKEILEREEDDGGYLGFSKVRVLNCILLGCLATPCPAWSSAFSDVMAVPLSVPLSVPSMGEPAGEMLIFLMSMIGGTSAAVEGLIWGGERGGGLVVVEEASTAVVSEGFCSQEGFESASTSTFFSLAMSAVFRLEEGVGNFCVVWSPVDWKT